VNKIIEEMKSQGVIEESRSPWTSFVVMVKKKNGSLRFCVDYRKLNSITVKDSYPLPRIEDILDQLSGNSWFSTLDLKSGYWQVKLEAPRIRRKRLSLLEIDYSSSMSCHLVFAMLLLLSSDSWKKFFKIFF